MPYWNFEYTKAVIYTVVKVGGGTGQDPATEVTHLRLNQPPVFSSVMSELVMSVGQSSGTPSHACVLQYQLAKNTQQHCSSVLHVESEM